MSLKRMHVLKILCCGFILLAVKQTSTPVLAYHSTGTSWITGFPEPHHHTWGPTNIVSGYHQDLWFTYANASDIGHITTQGVITEYAANILPGYDDANPVNIAVDRNDDAWFSGDYLVNEISKPNNLIDRMAPGGIIARFHIPSGKSPGQLLLGPDGNIWFLEFSQEVYPRIYTGLGSITPTGKISEWPLPTPGVGNFAWGPDATLWVTFPSNNLLAQISLDGNILAAYPFPYPLNQLSLMPDGQLWFYSAAGSNYALPYSVVAGTISSTGSIHLISFTTYAARLLDSKGIRGFTVDPAGDMWFSAVNTDQLMRFYPDMNVTIYQIVAHNECGEHGICYPAGITTGPDHNIWFAEQWGNRIARIDPNALP